MSVLHNEAFFSPLPPLCMKKQIMYRTVVVQQGTFMQERKKRWVSLKCGILCYVFVYLESIFATVAATHWIRRVNEEE